MAILGRFRRGFSRLLTPYLVLTFGFVLSAAAASYVYSSSRARDEARFTALVNEVEDAVKKRIDTYTAILRASRGFVVTQPRYPSYAAFEAFVEQIGLETKYPGVQGVGYSVRMPASEVGALEAFAHAQGFAGFRVWPRTTGESVDSILFLYPLDRRNRAALGFNMYSEARRREAMDRARDTGEPAASGRVTLVQEIDPAKQNGFLIYVPVYAGNPTTVEERRRRLLGFVYSPFRADDLLREVVRNLSQIDFVVYDMNDPDPEHVLHRSVSAGAPLPGGFRPAYRTERVMSVAGRPWHLLFTSRPEFERTTGQRLAAFAFAIGFFVTVILYALARSLYQAWYRAEGAAQDLRASQASVRRNAAHLQMLADVSTSFAAARLDVKTVARRAVEYVTGRLADVAVLALADGESATLTPVAMAHVEPALAERMREVMGGLQVPIEGALLGRVFSVGEPLLISRGEMAGITGAEAFFATHPVHSVILAPLKVSGRTIGALGVGRAEPNPGFTPGDVDTLRDLADRAALALENARLYDEAQRAVELRDEFLSIASHELKTPLTPLQLQVQNLQRIAAANDGQVSPERLRTFVSITERQVLRLTALVNSLLDVSRIGAGKFELEPEPFDFVVAVREVLERFALEAERTGTEVRLHAPAPVEGTWDRMRIEQVITNLISNALKYGEHRPVDVFCLAESGRVELRVVDHGIGLPGDFAERAFERFTRAVAARSYGGLGLGLYIVKQIVLAHGGQVTAASGPEGTAFTVRLPLAPPRRPARAR